MEYRESMQLEHIEHTGNGRRVWECSYSFFYNPENGLGYCVVTHMHVKQEISVVEKPAEQLEEKVMEVGAQC